MCSHVEVFFFKYEQEPLQGTNKIAEITTSKISGYIFKA
jgi:hypothetical protein